VDVEHQLVKERKASVDSDFSDKPANWRVFEVNTVFNKKDKLRRFKGNAIDTAKYNCITFLPKNLFE
jgi:hypothetical protein